MPSTGPDLTVPNLTPPVLAAPALHLDADSAQMPDVDSPEVAARHGDYLIRSEERLQVRTVRTRSGWARLEKYVVTETRSVQVPVSREEIRVVYFDNDGVATGADGQVINAADVTAPAGLRDPWVQSRPDESAQDLARWLTVSEERVQISKETVAVERVRLQVDTVTEQQQVTEQVRHEQVELTQQPFPADPPSPVPDSGDRTTIKENQ